MKHTICFLDRKLFHSISSRPTFLFCRKTNSIFPCLLLIFEFTYLIKFISVLFSLTTRKISFLDISFCIQIFVLFFLFFILKQLTSRQGKINFLSLNNTSPYRIPFIKANIYPVFLVYTVVFLIIFNFCSFNYIRIL